VMAVTTLRTARVTVTSANVYPRGMAES
jgi:hypothetical protein